MLGIGSIGSPHSLPVCRSGTKAFNRRARLNCAPLDTLNLGFKVDILPKSRLYYSYSLGSYAESTLLKRTAKLVYGLHGIVRAHNTTHFSLEIAARERGPR